MNKRILLVDDERNLNQLIATNLKFEGYETESAYSGIEAIDKLGRFSPDLVVLDVMMPGMDGFEVLEHLRHASSIPVILLTAKNRVDDRIRGLTLGADDYLGKPFAIEELTARIEAVLRRSRPNQPAPKEPEETIAFASLKCNLAQHSASANGIELPLQNLEYQLLICLVKAGERVLSYNYLLSSLWEDDRGDIATLRVTVGKLRGKMKQALGYDPILTVHGIGYRLHTPANNHPDFKNKSL